MAIAQLCDITDGTDVYEALSRVGDAGELNDPDNELDVMLTLLHAIVYRLDDWSTEAQDDDANDEGLKKIDAAHDTVTAAIAMVRQLKSK